MKKLYQTEMRDEINRYAHQINPQDIFTQADIAHLPKPLQRYFEVCGYIGKPKMVNAEVIWANSAIKMGVNTPWMPLKTYQFNSVPRPFRIAYMQAKIAGFIPFEGRDIYTSQQGKMRGQLMKLFTLFDNHDPQLAQSGLATTFAEAVLIPSYMLQPYISWQAVDDNRVSGCIAYNGLHVNATFYFDDAGKFTHFYTEDRYMALPKREYVKTPFSIYGRDYIVTNGVHIPSQLSVCWHLETGDFEYFTGTISGLRYNLK